MRFFIFISSIVKGKRKCAFKRLHIIITWEYFHLQAIMYISSCDVSIQYGASPYFACTGNVDINRIMMAKVESLTNIK
jgi:hypothetical protein